MSASSWWHDRSRGQRVAIVVVGGVVAANALLSGLGAIVGAQPGGPVSSSLSTGEGGLEGWADLAADAGHPVRRAREPGALSTSEVLDGGATVIIADPERFDDRDLAALAGHDGRVVLLGGSSAPLASAAAGREVGWEGGDAADELRTWVPVASLGGAEVIAGDRGGRWRDVGELVPVVGDAQGPAVVASADGSVVALADAAPLANDALARADNAALALGLLGDPETPVVFVESVRATGPTGLAAAPTAWRWAGAGLALALAVGLWAAGARFGPPEPDARTLRPPRRDHVAALAADLDRAGGDP